MLHFIYGLSGSGKSAYIRQRIQEQLGAPAVSPRVMLIVPEQFSYEAEKDILLQVGPQGSKKAEVYSFTRLCNAIFRRYGGLCADYITDAAKHAVMELAVEQAREQLTIYSRQAGRAGFVQTMCSVAEELRHAGITPQTLEEKTTGLSGSLKEKTQDIQLIFTLYDALLHERYADASEDLTRALELLRGSDMFAGYTIYIDEFKGLTAVQLAMLQALMEQCDEMYVSLCIDVLPLQGQCSPLFESVFETAKALVRAATRAQVRVGEHIRLPLGSAQERLPRFCNPALDYLSRGLFGRKEPETEMQPVRDVSLWEAQDIYQEVTCAASEICTLVRKRGFRYRDIAVVTRQMETYREIVRSVFEKQYGIPLFMDERQDMSHWPLPVFLLSFLEAADTLDSGTIFRMAKCGLLPVGEEEVYALEQYCFVWGINGKKAWEKPFFANPAGFSETFGEDEHEALRRLNDTRAALTEPLLRLHEDSKAGLSGTQMSQRLYEQLLEYGIDSRVEQAYQTQLAVGEVEAARQEKQVWDSMMELLSVLSQTLGDTRIELRRYADLLRMGLSCSDLGHAPQTLDAVTFGSAERVRLGQPRAVFLIGVNDRQFPLVPAQEGVFTDKERQTLIDSGLPLSRPSIHQIYEERFIAYKAATAASELLFLSYPLKDARGKALSPSPMVDEIAKQLSLPVCSMEQADPLERVAGKKTAYQLYAEHLHRPTALSESAGAFLKEDPAYRVRVERLDCASRRPVHRLKEPGTARELYGSSLWISPSSIESFHRCKYLHFLRYGLRLRTMSRAQLSPLESGNVIHRCLYDVVSQTSRDQFLRMSRSAMDQAVRDSLSRYLKEMMSGAENKTQRFQYLFRRLSRTMTQILVQLQQEFQAGSFAVSDCELRISDEADICPLYIKTSEGTELRVAGVIDRVDTYEKAGKRYLRIIDYKSGAKEFVLDDLYYGLNLQMMLYLLMAWKNGRGKYDGVIPAGILYFRANDTSPSLERDADADAVESARHAQYRMSGILLDDETSLRAMEQDLKGVFIPCEQMPDGSYTKASRLMDLQSLGRLKGYTDQLLEEMARSLLSGEIEARPVSGLGYDPCAYCDYRDVCDITTGVQKPCREIGKLTEEQKQVWLGGAE